MLSLCPPNPESLMKLLTKTTLILTACCCAAPASATLTAYFNRADFELAAGPLTIEDFDGIPLQSVPTTGGTITTPGFDIVVDENHNGVGIIESFPGRALIADTHDPILGPPEFTRFVFPSSITAFGSDFDDIDEGGLLDVRVAGQTFQIPNSTDFFGIVATGGMDFSEVELRTTNSIAEFYEMDNVSYGRVPEPVTMTLAAVGGGLLLLRRGNR